uniref:magnesium chelatase subunit ChlI family protein n=2 Tax=unclassified Pseudomonas TaxID=196821 RepID=UPI0040542CDC
LSVPRETTRLDANAEPGPNSTELAAQVVQARQQQLARQGCANAHLDLNGVQQHCSLQGEDRQWLENACERLGLSLRAAHRVLKVARTLADLDSAAHISRSHLGEALQYRPSISGA